MDEEQKRRIKLDALTIIAIIIMLVGVVLVINETKVCKQPFKQIIDKQLKEDYKDFPEINTSYGYARLDLYRTPEDISPFTSYDVVGNKIYRINQNNNFNFSQILIK